MNNAGVFKLDSQQYAILVENIQSLHTVAYTILTLLSILLLLVGFLLAYLVAKK